MGTIVSLPRSGNPPVQSLSATLDLARAEQETFLAFRLTRRDFERSRSLDDEALMIAARDKWAHAYAARHRSAA